MSEITFETILLKAQRDLPACDGFYMVCATRDGEILNFEFNMAHRPGMERAQQAATERAVLAALKILDDAALGRFMVQLMAERGEA